MSPVPEIERLEKASGKSQVDAAISACISREVAAGRDQEQAVGMCHEMARKQTGGEPAKKEES